MKIALIGYGEVGRILAEDLTSQAHSVVAYDTKLEVGGGNALREHAAKFGRLARGGKGTTEFARNADWRVEADRILNRIKA